MQHPIDYILGELFTCVSIFKLVVFSFSFFSFLFFFSSVQATDDLWHEVSYPWGKKKEGILVEN